MPEESEDISPSKSKTNKADDETKAEAEMEKDVEAESENSYDPLFDDEGDGQDQTVDVEASGEPNSLDTMSAPSAGLSLPGLTLPAAPSSPGTQSKPAPDAPAAAKLPEVSRVALPSYSDGSLPQLGEDIFLSAALDGECLIWDRRASSGAVRRLDIPKASSPWCISVSHAAAKGCTIADTPVRSGHLVARRDKRLCWTAKFGNRHVRPPHSQMQHCQPSEELRFSVDHQLPAAEPSRSARIKRHCSSVGPAQEHIHDR